MKRSLANVWSWLSRASITCLFLASLTLAAPAIAQNFFGSDSGLPLPRFVSLASGEVNVRSGPGKDYPIRWVFTRSGLPVQVTDEADGWRKIIDFEGGEGWIHSSLLTSDRTVIVTEEIRDLRRSPSLESIAILQLEPGVVGELVSCERWFCMISVNDKRGWLLRDEFWGVLEGEDI